MNWYAILTAVGIVVLLLGLAMSPTETQTTTTCVDSGYQYGSGCIDTTYEAPNPARGLLRRRVLLGSSPAVSGSRTAG